MRLILLLICSSFLLSCGKHIQSSYTKDGVAYTVQVKSAEAVVQSILNEDIEEIKKIITSGGNVDQEIVSTGRTLLTEACFWTKFKVIDFLIKQEAQINLKDKHGKSAEDYAAENQKIKRLLYPELILQLKKNLILTFKKNALNEVKKILEESPPVNFHITTEEFGTEFAELDGETLLTFLLKMKNENGLRLLAQPKFELDVNQKNKLSESPLELCKKLNLKNAEKILLKLGATI